MINFDVYKYNPTAAAALISRTSECCECPMIINCDKSPCYNKKGFSDSSFEKTQKCFQMWENFFKDNPETLESADDLAEILEQMTDCDKCEIAKEYECNSCSKRSCGETFIKWLCKEFSICQESRQVEEESDSVNHPDHYMLIDGVEVIDVINEILTRSDFTAVQGFYLGNVLKYILRADMKNGVEDYKKAAVYLNWLIESM